MNWFYKFCNSENSKLFHGTCEEYANQIRSQGFQISTSGGGQRGLMGVWLTYDIKTANIYAKGHGVYDKSKIPCILEVKLKSGLNIADLTHKGSRDVMDIRKNDFMAVGLDVDNENDLETIRSQQPFSLTKLMKAKGYDGAWISNTLSFGYHGVDSYELVVFDPDNLLL